MTQDEILKCFYFVLILHLISGKVTKFSMEKLSASEVISNYYMPVSKIVSNILMYCEQQFIVMQKETIFRNIKDNGENGSANKSH